MRRGLETCRGEGSAEKRYLTPATLPVHASPPPRHRRRRAPGRGMRDAARLESALRRDGRDAGDGRARGDRPARHGRGSLLAADVAEAVVETAGDGIYQSDIHLAQKHPIEPIRYWLVVDAGDGTLRLASLDLNFTPRSGAAMYTGEAAFTHTDTS